ncbi:helix-turn-helix domain-containing protein [Bacteroides sp.]
METEELQNLNVHHGHNIRRTRIEKGIKQDAMAKLVNLSQPAVSRYEQTKVIDDEMLRRFSRALNVPVEYLKTLEEDAPSVVFENISNDVHDNDNISTPSGYAQSTTNNFNPIDKITELYERLLKEKDEKYAALEQRIRNLEQQK